MSLESITEHILNVAYAEAERIIQEAKIGAEKIFQEAKTEGEKLCKEILDKEKGIYDSQKQRLIVTSRLESKKNALKVKQELIDRVFEKLKSEAPKDKFKKYQVLQDKIKEVPEEIDFYLHNIRLKYEAELAKVLFA